MRETKTLRARVARIMDEHGQAKVARATGVPQSSVSRYAKDRRIPAAFCVALVRHFDVNPAWLLAGEGEPYLTDITGATARMAGELLELVQAMGRVTRLRFGALAGRDHAQVLRELNRQLETYERTRAKLHERTQPILARVVADLERTLEAGRLERGEELAQAAGQVARLCDDEDLCLELEQSRAYIAFERGRLDEALTRQRRVFRRHLARGPAQTELERQKELNTMMTLVRVGRYREARRVARALDALHLDDGPAARAPFRAAQGLAMLEMPERGPRALQLIHDAWPLLGDWALINRAALVNAHELMGVQDSAAAADGLPATWSTRTPPARFVDAVVYLRMALSREDATILRGLLAFAEAPLAQAGIPRLASLVPRAHALAEALEGRAGSAWRAYRSNPIIKEAANSADPREQFVAAAAACQIARRVSARHAWPQLEAAERALAALPDGVLPPIRERWIHAGNVLALDGPRRRSATARAARERAERFCTTVSAAGIPPPA